MVQISTQCARILRLTMLFALISVLVMSGSQARAQVQPGLGVAASFVVLAGTTVTNTGPTMIGGHLGVSPGAAVTNFPPGILLPPAAMYLGDAVSLQAQNDVTTAFNTLAAEPCSMILPASIGTLTLTPGIYCFTSDVTFTTPSLGLTLNLLGDPNSLFVFKIPSQLTTQPSYTVNWVNGSAPCNVWWQVGSSATLDTMTRFVGNILASTSISLATGASLLPGRAFAGTGAVTLDTNTINMFSCSAAAVATATAAPPPPPDTPAPMNTTIPANTLIPTDMPTPVFPAALPVTGYPHPDATLPNNRLPIILATLVAVSGLFLLGVGTWTTRRKLP